MYFLHYDSETVNNNILRNSDVYVDNSEGEFNNLFKLLHVEIKPLGYKNQYRLKMSGGGVLASWYNLNVTSTIAYVYHYFLLNIGHIKKSVAGALQKCRAPCFAVEKSIYKVM